LIEFIFIFWEFSNKLVVINSQ